MELFALVLSLSMNMLYAAGSDVPLGLGNCKSLVFNKPALLKVFSSVMVIMQVMIITQKQDQQARDLITFNMKLS